MTRGYHVTSEFVIKYQLYQVEWELSLFRFGGERSERIGDVHPVKAGQEMTANMRTGKFTMQRRSLKMQHGCKISLARFFAGITRVARSCRMAHMNTCMPKRELHYFRSFCSPI